MSISGIIECSLSAFNDEGSAHSLIFFFYCFISSRDLLSDGPDEAITIGVFSLGNKLYLSRDR